MSSAKTPPRGLLWLRAELKPDEARAVIVPADAAVLLADGYEVVIEESDQRAYPVEDYAAVGCRQVASGQWRDAPDDAIIIGLKELDPALGPFRHQHVHFAHAFKGQRGWQTMLRAFMDGGGRLFDLEYLVDANGRRVAAFGYRAGHVGTALGLLAWARRVNTGSDGSRRLGACTPWSNADALIGDVRAAVGRSSKPPCVLVIGALGRSGRGACDTAREAGAELIEWDVAETAAGGPFDALLDVDIVVNCVFLDRPVAPFTTLDHLNQDARRLSVIVDVSCDPFGEGNPLPLYSAPTTMNEPVIRLLSEKQVTSTEQVTGSAHVTSVEHATSKAPATPATFTKPTALTTPSSPASTSEPASYPTVPALDLIAIDHLPSLLPRESSVEFSGLLLPYVRVLADVDSRRVADVAPDQAVAVWTRAESVFEERCRQANEGTAVI